MSVLCMTPNPSFSAFPFHGTAYRDWNVEKNVLMDFAPDKNLCLTADTVRSLKEGYDRNRPKTQTRAEAIRTIQLYVKDPRDLVCRLMMTKDILLNYLMTIRPLVNRGLLKRTLEDMILLEWGQAPIQQNNYTFVQQNFYNVEINDLQNALMELCISFSG